MACSYLLAPLALLVPGIILLLVHIHLFLLFLLLILLPLPLLLDAWLSL